MKPPIIFYGELFLFLKDMLVSWPHTLGAADVFNHSNFLWYFFLTKEYEMMSTDVCSQSW